ncbi:hypothetical protein [Arenicella xantha]|uniref:Uncharacterized protein n=1 Tax=Arenicella xantha TaxID=644221 RepID=A0A395JF89_9GAMM|nr:hypothetical protein [Arenicella xantha]RBP48303.1 hypothetical protein DFR28_10832 [Arenicella xantha]
MQLDKLIIETRLRTGWSAIDLGIALGRRFWLRSFALYLVIALPVFWLTRTFVTESYWLPYFIIWWCKPLFERPSLYFLSRELFQQDMGFWQTLRNWRDWIFPGLGWILTIRRISVGRGMYAPITLLESPSAGQYSKRASVLGSKYASQASWLTVVLFHFESFLAIAAVILLEVFFPDQITFGFGLFEDFQNNSAWVDLGSLMMMAVVAPFYVASGFMLYISRRIELEGWDIEICFRDWMSEQPAASSAMQRAAGPEVKP